MTTKLLQEILIPVYGDITIIGFEEAFSFDGYHFEYQDQNEDFTNKESINVHELANFSKKWAWENGYEIRSGFEEEWYCEYKLIKDLEFCFYIFHSGDSEPEAIFKVCEMILKNKD
jgi:hypothetical protein